MERLSIDLQVRSMKEIYFSREGIIFQEICKTKDIYQYTIEEAERTVFSALDKIAKEGGRIKKIK